MSESKALITLEKPISSIIPAWNPLKQRNVKKIKRDQRNEIQEIAVRDRLEGIIDLKYEGKAVGKIEVIVTEYNGGRSQLGGVLTWNKSYAYKGFDLHGKGIKELISQRHKLKLYTPIELRLVNAQHNWLGL